MGETEAAQQGRTKSNDRGGQRSEVEDGHVEKVAQAFRLVQVVYVVVVAGRRGQAEERREDWGIEGQEVMSLESLGTFRRVL